MASSSKNSPLQTLPTTTEEAIELFDSLPPATSEQMIGRWVGSDIPTGHSIDGILPATWWYGKAFYSPSDVRPLIYRLPVWGEVQFKPSPTSMQLLGALPPFAGRNAILASITWLLSFVLATQRPHARLDTVKFRGEHRAAMIYDGAPIIDFFAKLDDDTVLGWMDMRDMEKPYFFKLRRETPADLES